MTWNMAYMKPGRYKSKQNRRRQWALLAAISPDVALLQECRPDDLATLAPPWMAEEYDILTSAPDRMAGSAVLARKAYQPEHIDSGRLPESEQRWLTFFARYVGTARLTVEGAVVNVASVHALAGEVNNAAITDDDHLATKRASKDRARYNDVAANALLPLTRESQFIIGGDWNIALLFDTTSPATAPGSAEFFAARTADGWHHALRKFSPAEVRTYLDPKSAAYELDHIFTDHESHSTLTACHVLSDPVLQALSDHAPLMAEFSTGRLEL